MARKRKKRQKIKAKPNHHVNRLWWAQTSPVPPTEPGSGAKRILEVMPRGRDTSYVVVVDVEEETCIFVDKHGVKTKEFEASLIRHINQQRYKVIVIVGKEDIEACDVSIVEQTISTINNARYDSVIGGDEGIISILPYGLHHDYLTGFEQECKQWCRELAQQVPGWWYFLDKEGKPHETAAYWMTVNVSQRMQRGISKLSATQLVLASVNSLPNSSESEQKAIEWLRKQNLLPR